MKNFIKYILILIIGIVLGYFITIHNIKITATEKNSNWRIITSKSILQ